jgi:uncharacterized membrane protein YqiK
MAVLIAFILGVALVATPIVLDAVGIHLGTASQVTMTASGAAMILFSAVAFVFTRLYHKTKASEAFVRTGQGGAKVIQDGGAVIVPFIHELVRVSLRTQRLEVIRANENSLITHDKLRADIRAEFFVRVDPEVSAILQAARSLGDGQSDHDAVKLLVEDKLVSALRTAAATKTLEELNSERDKFLEKVTTLLQNDLKNNGLVLETVTISALDQTDPKFLKTNNIFDAQGSKKIAEITQASLTERNALERTGEETRKQQDVENRKRILAMEQDEKRATATQEAEVAQLRATATRDSTTKVIEMEKETQLANIGKQRDLEVAETQRQQALALAEELKGKEVSIAQQAREQATLVAQQQKEAAGATAQAEKAEQQRILAKKEAEVASAQQEIETIKITQQAERAKAKSVIEAQAEAQRSVLKSNAESDAQSYQIETGAKSRRLAADAEAEAVLKKATAETDADKMRAGAEKVRAMVPVDVRRAEVEVERDRVETVVKPELEAREKHGKVAQDFEIAKMQVIAEKEVRIAFATAQATVFSRMEAKFYGSPADAAKMLASFTGGQSLATTVEGLAENMSESSKTFVGDAVVAVGRAAVQALQSAPSAPNGK